MKAPKTHKVCKACEREKPIEEYYMQGKYRAAKCKKCHQIYQKAWQERTGYIMPSRNPNPGPQGFASLSPERRSQVSRLGGHAVAIKGTGHRFTTETGRVAGKKGGLVRKKNEA